MSTSWRDLEVWASGELAGAGLSAAQREARWMVEQASGFDGAELFAELDATPVERAEVRLRSMVERRIAGEPLQYVLGRWGFRSLDLAVDRRVLIPRPETESVVDEVLVEVDRLAGPDREPVTVVDLGTGSGAIALSVASERAVTTVWATDVSADALVVATANLSGLGRAAARVRLAQGSWFDALPDELRSAVGVIASNPPYVDPAAALPSEVHEWEPHVALYAGDVGRSSLDVLVRGSGAWLRPDGALVCEISPEQAEWVTDLAEEHYCEARVHPDLSGRDRVLVARSPRR